MTALTYNPVRILGLAGLGLVGLGIVVALLSLATNLAPARDDGRFAYLFAALVLASAGVNVFSIGATFNYIVSLFHQRRIRQGLLGRPIFRTPLEAHFGWMGVTAILAGILVYGVAVWQHWTDPTTRAPWFARP